MSRAESYANWLVQNKANQNSAEYQKVAEAYRQLRTTPKETDGALAYSVDNAQKLAGRAAQTVGAATGWDSLRDWGEQYAIEQDVDIREGGYESPLGDLNFLDAYKQGRAWEWIGTRSAENAATIAATPVVAGGSALAAFMGAPVTAVVLGGGATVTGVTLGVGSVAETANEKGLDINDPSTAQKNVAIGTVIGLLDKVGAGKIIPKNKIASMSTQDIVTEIAKKDPGAAKKFMSAVLRGGLGEGATEGAQSLVESGGVALQGGQFTADEIANDFIDSVVLGKTVGSTMAGTTSVASSTAGAFSEQDVDQPAAAELAQRLQGIADMNGYDMNDVAKSSTAGARETVDAAHVQMTEEVKSLVKDLRERLSITDSDPESVVLDKVLATAGTRQQRNKAKNIVGRQEMLAVKRLAGDTQEGLRLISLMRQSNELTRLHNGGYVGGLSKFTDQLSPLPSNVGYSDRSLIETPTRLIATAAGATLNPAITAAQGAAVVGGRTIDKITGKRSRVKAFLKRNKKGEGINISAAPSLREERQKEAEQIKEAAEADRQIAQELHEDIYNDNGTFSSITPQQMMLDEIGLSPKQAVKLLQILAADPRYANVAQRAIKSLKSGGRIPNMPQLTGKLNTMLDADRAPVKRDRKRQTGAINRSSGGQESPGYLRGIADNQNAVDTLIEAVTNDPSISHADRATLINALADMRANLGSNPAQRATEIVNEAEQKLEDPELSEEYLVPYLRRVVSQQGNDIEAMDDVFGLGDDMGLTSVDIAPDESELAQMSNGTYKPEVKRTLESAYGDINNRWQERSGRTEPLEYTPENVERIARMMATEARRALQNDSSAIGWYDAKLKAAKAVMRLVEPRIEGNEQAFDFALAITSNGQAVIDNFAYALDAFREYLDTGKMPENWNKGGERVGAMRKSFAFFNAYNASGINYPIGEFLDQDFTVRELNEWLDKFNKARGTDYSLSSQENVDAQVKGSFILGAKIGQGFYQNVRGNYDPLTMDIWWMRMWNRLVGRPFKPEKSPKQMQKNRDKVLSVLRDKDAPEVEQTLIKQALKRAGTNRSEVYRSKSKLDDFIVELDRVWQSYYKKFQQENGFNPEKPPLFKTTGTHRKNLKPELQATPTGGAERAYMREVTQRARGLLKDAGYDINTADFQALLWYPEKQLAEKLGIQKGRGEDNDYLDAAIVAAKKEGITDAKIKEALPDAERGRLSGGANVSGGSEGDGSIVAGFDGQQTQFDNDVRRPPNVGSSPPSAGQVRDQLQAVEELFAQGKPVPIGQPGTPFENGIQDRAAIARIAEALGYIFEMYANPSQMVKGIEKRFGAVKGRNSSAFRLGFLFAPADPRSMKRVRQGGEVRGMMGILDEYKSRGKKQRKISLQESIWAGLHELGHGIERLRVNEGALSVESDNVYRTPDGDVSTTDRVFTNTFRDIVMKMIDASSGKSKRANIFPQEVAKEIIDEMIELQRTGVLQIGDVGSTRVRTDYLNVEKAVLANMNNEPRLAEIRKKVAQGEKSYVQTPAEFAADMIGAYMADPQGFKKQAPSAAALVQSVLNTANQESGKFVQFYSAPLAAVLAVVLAALAAGDDEEERRGGVLATQPGALSI